MTKDINHQLTIHATHAAVLTGVKPTTFRTDTFNTNTGDLMELGPQYVQRVKSCGPLNALQTC